MQNKAPEEKNVLFKKVSCQMDKNWDKWCVERYTKESSNRLPEFETPDMPQVLQMLDSLFTQNKCMLRANALSANVPSYLRGDIADGIKNLEILLQ
jgi:hypothetical protein